MTIPIFEAAARPTFTAPVEITMPGNGDDGAPEKHTVVIEFKRLPRKDLDALQLGEVVFAEVAKDVVTGWRGLLDTQSVAVPFSAEMLDALLAVPGAPRAIWLTFMEYSYGAVRKN